MGLKRIVTRNIAANWLGTAVTMLVGFFVAPFLVNRLGDTDYGLWILIGSLTGYFGLLDLGVRSSVGRYVAFYRAKNDQDGVNATISSALTILSGVGALALIAVVCVALIFARIFDVPVGQQAAVRLALLIVGLNIALRLPLDVFDATLWGFQRFDILNAIDIPVVLLRGGLTFYLIGRGHGLVTLAIIALGATLLGTGAKAVMSYREDRALRLRATYVSKRMVRRLFGFGLWAFVMRTGYALSVRVGPIIIGACLTAALVTPYSIAMRLVGYANAILMSATGVLTPVATAFHAQESHSRQRTLFVEGGKYCMALALFFFVLFVFLGRSLISLWMGPRFSYAWSFLLILGAGHAFAMGQKVTGTVLLGMARHKPLAYLEILNGLSMVALSLALVNPYGVLGVCVAAAISATVFQGAGRMVYGCRVLDLPLRQYLTRAVLLPLAVAVPPAVLLGLLVRWRPATTWAHMFLYTAAFGVCYGVACVFLVGLDRLKGFFSAVSKASFEAVQTTTE